MKQIMIGSKKYNIDCNAFTFVKYRHFFKSGILLDMQKIEIFISMQSINEQRLKEENPNISEEELEEKLGSITLPYIDDFVDKITKIAWILIYSANKNIEEYEDWLRSITNFSITDSWITEVTEYAVNCFCRSRAE